MYIRSIFHIKLNYYNLNIFFEFFYNVNNDCLIKRLSKIFYYLSKNSLIQSDIDREIKITIYI